MTSERSPQARPFPWRTAALKRVAAWALVAPAIILACTSTDDVRAESTSTARTRKPSPTPAPPPAIPLQRRMPTLPRKERRRCPRGVATDDSAESEQCDDGNTESNTAARQTAGSSRPGRSTCARVFRSRSTPKARASQARSAARRTAPTVNTPVHVAEAPAKTPSTSSRRASPADSPRR